MEMNDMDYLKKTLIDTQERVRDFMHYSQNMKDKNLKKFFRSYAESEGYHAQRLQELIDQTQ
jgi:rubrerythrin